MEKKKISAGMLLCCLFFGGCATLYGIMWFAHQGTETISPFSPLAKGERANALSHENESALNSGTHTSGKTPSPDDPHKETKDISENFASATTSPLFSETFSVVSVIDGDTIKVAMHGKVETIRLIGIDTPETVHPSKPVECMGREASDKTKSLLSGKRVRVLTDVTQGERDKYGRVLAYIFLGDMNVNQTLIEEGYAYEYTYALPYRYQFDFKEAQRQAQIEKKGLWSGMCDQEDFKNEKNAHITTPASPSTQEEKSDDIESTDSCPVKGNITSSGEHIYHTVGCKSFDKTVIDEKAGERCFQNEAMAMEAGWRKAQNCARE